MKNDVGEFIKGVSIGLLFLTMGLIAAYVIYVELSKLHDLKEGVVTTGKVIAMETKYSKPSSSNRNVEVNTPIIEFQTPEGTKTTRLNFGSTDPFYEIGDEVEVVYSPDDQSKVAVKGFANWFLIAGISLFALIFGGGGAFVLYNFIFYEITGRTAKSINMPIIFRQPKNVKFPQITNFEGYFSKFLCGLMLLLIGGLLLVITIGSFSFIMLFFALIPFIAGISRLCTTLIRYFLRTYLSQHGEMITAKIVDCVVVRQNSHQRVWFIKAEANYMGKEYKFTSYGIRINPKEYLSDVIPVIINPNNPNKYVMDLSKILPKDSGFWLPL